MTVDSNSEEGQIIRQLIPLSTMPSSHFEQICHELVVEEAKANTFLFKKNDTDKALIYLIKGSISLQSDNLIVGCIDSGTESSRFALAHQLPRKIDAITLTKVRFLRLDINVLDSLPKITQDQEETSFMAIDEPEEDNDIDDDDWMTTLLKSPIFSALPAANLQQIIISLEEVTFKKGEFIINQGEQGDFYYLIKKGHCLISRKPSDHAKEIRLAHIRSQDTFGEDSLLSGNPRNVSIRAITNVTLLRLSKDKFISLIKEPSLKFIQHAEITDEINNGAILIDVRAPDEYKSNHLPHTINIPFFSLRVQLKVFDKTRPVIVICKNGKTSEAAAFLLLRNQVQAKIVEGGMESILSENNSSVAVFDPGNDDKAVESYIEPVEPKTNVNQENIATDITNNADNALELENQQLKQQVKTLQQEKEILEKKFRMLYKQTEKLKSVLDSLKK